MIVAGNGREIFIAPQALNLHTLSTRTPAAENLPLTFERLYAILRSSRGEKGVQMRKHPSVTIFSDLRVSDRLEPQPTVIENLAILAEPSSFYPLWQIGLDPRGSTRHRSSQG
jgi:hypothetical protein